jgi:hypothetical protein
VPECCSARSSRSSWQARRGIRGINQPYFPSRRMWAEILRSIRQSVQNGQLFRVLAQISPSERQIRSLMCAWFRPLGFGLAADPHLSCCRIFRVSAGKFDTFSLGDAQLDGGLGWCGFMQFGRV